MIKMKVELEMDIEQEDSAAVLYKLSELANKAKELGFIVTEAEIENDDTELANVDLQNILQKQQQTLQMMSNISKMLHDTSMAVIRKIGA